MSIDLFGADDAKTAVDFLVQIGILIGFGSAAIGFIYKVIVGRLDKAIDVKIEPVKQSQKDILKKVDDLQKDLCSTSRNKEELDRERFRNVSDSQNFIKDSIKTSIDNVDEIKKKLESHLHDSAAFIARTNEKFLQMDQQLIEFRSFMRMVENR